MNWKNVSIETGFVKQEISVNGTNAVNYIPIDQIDSFGVVNSENKRWLFAGIFFGIFAILSTFTETSQGLIIFGMVSAGLILTYFMTRKTWFTITSSQTKFSVQVMTSKEEILAVNAFVIQIKNCIHSSVNDRIVSAA